MQNIIAIIIAYLLGSISTSIILCKFLHLADPRTLGSKNPGATNMLRIAGKKIALFTLFGDALKGVIAVLIGRLLHVEGMMLGFVALAAFVGHIFPIFFGFKGGKGVATGLGSLLALAPLVGICVAMTWILVVALSRYSSLSAIVASASAPIFAYFFAPLSYLIPILIMSALLLWRHKTNISRLLLGEESKIGRKKDQ